MAILTSSVDTTAEAFRAKAALYQDILTTLRSRYQWSLAGGGERMVERHRERGKIPARDRIDLLVDPMRRFSSFRPSPPGGFTTTRCLRPAWSPESAPCAASSA